MSYCVRADIEARFGAANVAKWADKDNNGNTTAITAAIAAAIEQADEEIDSRLRSGRYTVPVVGLDTLVPVLIKVLSTLLSGAILYDTRGVEDIDPTTGQPLNRMAWFRRHVEMTLENIVSGRLKINAVQTASEPPVPEVVKETSTDSTTLTCRDFV